jgi:hypothetical protein
MRTTWILIVPLAASLLVSSPASAKKAPACPGGRYLVPGTTLTGALDATPPDVILVDGKTIAIESGCNPVKATLRGTANGTKVRARWKSCPGVEGKAILSGTMMEQCRSFSGTFTAKSAGIAKPFLATLSRCGDGIWDEAGGEECDAGLGPCGDLCNACACTAGGATTTTTTSPSGTTIPGGGTSSTTTTPGASTTTTTAGGGGPTSSTTTTPGATTTTITSAGPTTTMFMFPTTSSTTTTAPGATTSSTMPALPTTTTTSTTLATPDLAGSEWMSPPSAPSGSTIAIQFTVKNFGTQTATASPAAPWYDYILISNDLILGNDQAIGVYPHTTNLAAGASYTQLVQPTLPAVPPGTYYLFLHTDPTNAVAESNENNNIGAVQIIIN